MLWSLQNGIASDATIHNPSAARPAIKIVILYSSGPKKRINARIKNISPAVDLVAQTICFNIILYLRFFWGVVYCSK